MFCPTCGSEIEEMIEHNGAKICPKCGCVVEIIEQTNEDETPHNELSSKLAVCGIVLAGVLLGLLMSGVFFR